MELLAIIFIGFLVVVLIKAIGLFFQAGVFVIALPFKILGIILSAALVAVFIIPVALVFASLPLLLIFLGIWLISRA